MNKIITKIFNLVKNLRRLPGVSDAMDNYSAQLARQYEQLRASCEQLGRENEETKILMGKILAGRNKSGVNYLQDAEFKVFSQWGDDGIIQYLINQVRPPVETFIEFGVENYKESNTRFLLLNNNWKGLVLDCSEENIRSIRSQPLYWKHDITAVPAMVSAENINRLFADAGFTGETGLLHIDIDGNDYWVWKAINVIQPVIVIMEYNSVLGADRAITIPYDPSFNRTKAHHTNLYFGASLPALCKLAKEKGYSFVGSNSNGNNAYFVRNDKIGNIKVLSPQEGFVYSKFRESRDDQGNITFISGKERLAAIKGSKVINVVTNKEEDL